MKVELVAKTVGVGKYEDLNSEEIIAAVARHGNIKEDNGKLVKYLMDHKHLSPLEFINFTFEIETSRSIGRQILRHRSMSGIQEHSTRYSDRVEFESIELRREHPTNRQSSTDVFNPVLKAYELDLSGGRYDGQTFDWKASDAVERVLYDVEYLYNELLKAGVAKECAREILPNCLKTTMTFNGTFRTWLSFLNVRMDEDSQIEIRRIAEEIGNELEKELPDVMGRIDWRKGMFL